MPIIKVWCLTANQDGEVLRSLHQTIVGAVLEVTELNLRGENDMTVLFPTDMMVSYETTDEVIIEISGLFLKTERTPEVRNRLAESVGRCVKIFYPDAKVECFVTMFEPWQGFWTSEE